MPSRLYDLYQWMNGESPHYPFWWETRTTPISENFLRTRGATAISRTIPNAPNVSVTNSLAELKDGLPDLFFRSLRKGGPGGEFLNFQFGVLPTWDDQKAIHEASQKAEKIIAQWRRDSQRRIRRRYTFEDDITTTTETYANEGLFGVPGQLNAYLASSGSLEVTIRTTTKSWFSGAYMYHIPDASGDLYRKIQDQNRVYGLLPTLSTAWELSPFSWLLDWETNVGDVIRNISYLGQDGCVLVYGYVMAQKISEFDFTWRGNISDGPRNVPTTLHWTVQTVSKERRHASPYGLGWTIESLSAKQIAILAALGLSSKGR